MAVPPGPSGTGSPRADTGWAVPVSPDVTVPADDVPDGLAVLDPRGHFVRLNRAALALCGGTGEDLTGTPGPFPLGDECGPGSPGLFDDDTAEQVTTYTPATGGQREFAYRLHPLSGDPRYTVVAFRDVTDERHRQRRVTALARTAAKLASQGTVSATLDALAAEVVQADGLAGVQILTRGESGGRLHVMGSAGFRHPADFFRRLTRVHERGGTLQMLTALRTREPVVIPGRWQALRDDPAWAPLHDYLVELDWDSFVSIPLITRGQSTGVLNAYLAPGQTVNARTMEFLTAMAEQAAIAVDYTALVERERDVARREERQQLARDLHDSVVQQVFSAGMHVKSMEVLAGRGDTVPAGTVARVSGEVGETDPQRTRGPAGDGAPAASVGVGRRGRPRRGTTDLRGRHRRPCGTAVRGPDHPRGGRTGRGTVRGRLPDRHRGGAQRGQARGRHGRLGGRGRAGRMAGGHRRRRRPGIRHAVRWGLLRRIRDRDDAGKGDTMGWNRDTDLRARDGDDRAGRAAVDTGGVDAGAPRPGSGGAGPVTGASADPVRVLIVDDHAVVRRGIRAYLDVLDDIEVAGEAGDGDDALDRLRVLGSHGELPDVVLLDLVMPRMDGVTAAAHIAESHPGVRVVVLTSFGELERVHTALATGVAGYLLKSAGPDEVAAAVHAAASDKVYLDPAVAQRLTREMVSPPTGLTALTERERDVLVLVARGHSNREIADRLVISERTARTHVSNLLRKLQLSSRTQAALVAVREGLVAARS